MLVQLKQEVDYLKNVVASMQPQGVAQPDGRAIGYEPRAEDPEEQELETEADEELSLKALGSELIDKVLRKHGGNRKEAARELGISERTLYRKLSKKK